MNNKERYDDMIVEITNVAIESYKQEQNRESILLTKSDYVIKYITATFVFVNAICALLITNEVIPTIIVCVMYFIVGASLCVSLAYSIRAQLLVKGEFFPTGVDVLNGMQEEYKKNGTEKSVCDLKMDTIKYYDNYTKTLQKANDDKAKKLKIAYRIYLNSVICIMVIFFVLCVIIA